jgi:alkylated DNA repair dioxygenase AlkB
VKVQSDLFDMESGGPEGFRYRADVMSEAEERALITEIEDLPLQAFQFHGFTGNRRVLSFGWRYDFGDEALHLAEKIPPFLIGAREAAAAFAGLAPDAFVHALVTEYSPNAGIGWHRDKAVFGEIVGLSLLSPCLFRLRRKQGPRSWERFSIRAERRSAYHMSGPARSRWEHSIPPVESLRYSVTFRTLRERE